MNTSKNLWKATDFQIKSTRKSGTDKMNFFKKSKLLLLLVSASLIFSSCGKQADLSLEADAETYNTGVEMRIENLKAEPKKESQTKIAEADMETIEPPEDGWTLEDLLSVTYIFNNQLTVPCSLESLGKSFSFEESSFSEDEKDSSVIVGTLSYNDDIMASINIAENDIKNIDTHSAIKRIIFSTIYSNIEENTITINGIGLKSSKSQVIEKIGEPDFTPDYVGEDYCYVYYEKGTDNNLLTINFDSDENVFLIAVNIND